MPVTITRRYFGDFGLKHGAGQIIHQYDVRVDGMQAKAQTYMLHHGSHVLSSRLAFDAPNPIKVDAARAYDGSSIFEVTSNGPQDNSWKEKVAAEMNRRGIRPAEGCSLDA